MYSNNSKVALFDDNVRDFKSPTGSNITDQILNQSAQVLSINIPNVITEKTSLKRASMVPSKSKNSKCAPTVSNYFVDSQPRKTSKVETLKKRKSVSPPSRMVSNYIKKEVKLAQMKTQNKALKILKEEL